MIPGAYSFVVRERGSVSELAEKYRLSPDQTVLDLLLEEHTEACETLHRGVALNVRTGNAEWGLSAPATWTEHHQRLARLLKDYHDHCKRDAVVRAKIDARDSGLSWATVDWKHDYWHLAQWYFLCRKNRVPQWMLGKDNKPRRARDGSFIQVVTNGQPRFVYEVVRRGDGERVLEGLKWLEKGWRERFRGRPRHVPWDTLLERAA